MIQEIVKWTWLGIILLFILSGLVYGAGRGLRKTLFRGGWLILTAVLLFFLVGPLVDLILGFDVTTFGIDKFSYNGVATTNLKDYLTLMICDNVGIENTAQNAKMIADVLQLIKLILNVFLFIILFIVFKWILYPLFALLYRLFFRGKAYKQYKKDLKAYKSACKKLKKVKAVGFASNGEIDFEETLTPIKEEHITPSLQKPNVPFVSNTNNIKNLENSNTTTTKVNINEPESSKKNIVEDKIVELPNLDNQPKETNLPEIKLEKPNNQKSDNKTNTVVIEKPVKPKKPKKHRLWGMLAGSVVGIFLCGITIMPFAGVMNIVNELNEKPATIIDENNTEDGLITALLKQNADSINIDLFGEKITADTVQYLIDNYNNGIGGIFYTYTGAKALSNVTFNELSSAKIGDVKIYLKEDLVNVVEVAAQVLTLKDSLNDTQNGYTTQNINTILNQTKNILNSAFSIQLIRGLGNHVIPVIGDVAENLIDNSDFDANDKIFYKEVINAILTNITNNSNAMDSIKSDLIEVIDVVKGLNTPFEHNETKSILTVLLNNNFEEDKVDLLRYAINNKDSISSLFNKTLNTRIISSVLPYGVYYIVNYLSDLYDFSLGTAITLEDFKELENIDDTLTSIIGETLTLVGSVDIDNLSYSSLSKDTFVCIGKIMDKVSSSLLPDETYINLVNMLETELTSTLPDLDFGIINLTNAIKGENGILKSLSDISNWEEEFTILGNFYDGLFTGETPIINGESIEDIDLVRLGAKIDLLSQTTLLGGGTETKQPKINQILGDALISYTDESITSLPAQSDRTESEQALYNIFSYLKDSVAPRLTSVSVSNPVISWENEFSELEDIINFITTADLEDLFTAKNGQNSTFVQLGTQIDNFIASGKSKLITETDVYTLTSYGIDYAKDIMLEDSDKDYLNNAIDEISNNINNISNNNETICFETEFKFIEKIYNNLENINLDDISSTCNTLGKLFDEIANKPNHSKLITNSVLVDMVSGVLKDFSSNLSSDGIGTAISNLLLSITGRDADNSVNPPITAIEGTLNSEVAGTVLGLFDSENTISALGKTFIFNKTLNTLKINDTTLELNKTNQATYEDVTYEVYKYNATHYALRIVQLYIDKSDPENPKTYNFWENELTKLASLTEIADIDLSNMDNLSIVGQKLDHVTNDGILSSKLITNVQLANLMTDVFVDIKSDITDGLTGTTLDIISDMLGDKSDLVNESIIGNLQGVANETIVITSWEQELNFLKTLTDIKDLSNIELETIGNTLDSIAYNYDSSANSILITHPIITTMIGNALDVFKPTSTGADDTTNNAIITAMNGIQANITSVKNETFNNLKTSNFKWKTELNYLDKLTELEDLENIDLVEVGAKLDSIAYNYTSNNSRFINHSIITTLIEDVLDVFKPTSSGTNDITNNAIITAINSMQINISSLKTNTFEQLSSNNFKWEYELEKLNLLKNLSINSSNYKDSGKLTSIGTTLDAVAFNENISENSQIISKDIINNLLADVLEIAKSGNTDPTNFDNTITSIINRIEDLETQEYYGKTNFTWTEELSKFEKLISVNFDSNNMGELLGNLKFENDGLYYNNQSTLVVNLNPIYNNEQDGAGIKLDELINNPDSSKNSVLITREIIDELLYSVIDEQSSTLSGDYSDIGNNIKNRLNKSHADYKTISSYTNELKSINYIMDLTKIYNNLDDGLAILEMETIGHYFDQISNSILVGDSGANVIIIILDAYENGENKPESIEDINAIVNTKTGKTNANLLGEIKKNVQDVNDNYNIETNNYETLYRSLGEMRDTFESLLDGIEFDFTFEQLTTGTTARQKLINMICNISETIEKLQQNEVCKQTTSKYIAIYTLDMLITKLEEIHNTVPYPTGFDKDYQNSLMNYFVSSLDRTETYFNSDWSGNPYQVPVDIVIPSEYDTTGTTNANQEFNYGLIKIVNSYLNAIPVVGL